MLLTSLSRKIPLIEAVKRSLAHTTFSGRILGGDSDGSCLGRHFVDRFLLLPRDDDFTLGDFASLCREHEVGWVIPTRDGELARMAEWATALAGESVAILVGPSASVTRCLDKLEFSRFWEGRPGHLPSFQAPDPGLAPEWVVKERFGSGSRGTVLGVSAEAAAQAAAGFACPVFQPLIKGTEYSVDLYLSRKGVPWGCVPRTRDLVHHGESQVSTVVAHSRLEELALELAGALGLRGHAVIQAVEEAPGQFRVLECNCRLGGASTLSLAAGLDSPAWFYRESVDPNYTPASFVRGKAGLRLIRYPCDRLTFVQSD